MYVCMPEVFVQIQVLRRHLYKGRGQTNTDRLSTVNKYFIKCYIYNGNKNQENHSKSFDGARSSIANFIQSPNQVDDELLCLQMYLKPQFSFIEWKDLLLELLGAASITI